VRPLRLVILLVPLAIAGAIVGCSSSKGTSKADSSDAGDEGSTGHDSGSLPDPSSKPPPKPKDAGPSDATPPKPPQTKDGGPHDAGKLTDAKVDATPPDASTTSATPLDPIDESIMQDEGLSVGSCVDVGLSHDTGFCRNDSAGQDFVEGCVDPTVYLLDCARYDTPGFTRSVCQDDGTTVGCYLHDVTPVGDFEKSDTGDAIDLFHGCPSSWEGTGFCDGDYLYMCSGGNDYVLDCGTFNTGSFTYTCAKDSRSGTIQCQ
jgi:hypothetical protein